MTRWGDRLGRVIFALIGIAYLLALCVTLIWWHLSAWIVLALTVGAIALVAITLRPYLGLHAFVMLLFVENAIPTNQGVTSMKVVGTIILGGWLCSVAMRGHTGIRFDRFLAGSLIFLAWSVVSVMYALDGNLALARLLTYALLCLAALMFASVVDSPARLYGLYAALVFWTCVVAIEALVEFSLGMTRVAVGLVLNRNLLALYLDIGMVTALLLHQVTRSRMVKLALVLAIPLLFITLCLTLSRTGVVVMMLGLLLVWYRVVRERGFLVLAGSAALLGVLTLLLPESFWMRMNTILPAIERQEDTFGTRVMLWKWGLRMVEDRPITGVGPGNFESTVQRYARGEMMAHKYNAHNTYINLAAELGSVGLVLFLVLMGLALRESQQAIRSAKAEPLRDLRFFAVTTEVNLILIMATGSTMTVETFKCTWMLLGIAIGIGRMARSLGGERLGRNPLEELPIIAEVRRPWRSVPLGQR